jgi:hypothetical protein
MTYNNIFVKIDHFVIKSDIFKVFFLILKIDSY